MFEHVFHRFQREKPTTIKVWSTDMPGLFDVEFPDGRKRTDLTVGQIETLAVQNGWPIERMDR